MSRVWDKERKKRKEKGGKKGADNHLFNLFPVFQGRDKEGEATVKASPRGKAESQRRRRVSQFFHDPSPKIVARYIEREESPTRDVDLAMTSDKRENLREESSREGESRQVCVLTYAWG